MKSENGMMRRLKGSMLKRMPEFIEQIADPAAFAKQFRIEQERLQKVLAKHSHLHDDFQFIIDTEGHLYHIDLDRNGRGEKEKIHDKQELQEELEWTDADMTWLYEHLVPSLLDPDEPRQRCQHSFCKTKKKKAKTTEEHQDKEIYISVKEE